LSVLRRSVATKDGLYKSIEFLRTDCRSQLTCPESATVVPINVIAMVLPPISLRHPPFGLKLADFLQRNWYDCFILDFPRPSPCISFSMAERS